MTIRLASIKDYEIEIECPDCEISVYIEKDEKVFQFHEGGEEFYPCPECNNLFSVNLNVLVGNRYANN